MDLRFGPEQEALAEKGEPGQAGEQGGEELTLEQIERRHIERVLRRERGHVERAAHRLGLPRSSLYERLRRLGIDRSRFQRLDPESG